MNSDTTETAFEAIQIMENKNFSKSEIATLLKSLDDRNMRIMQTWKQDLVTRKELYWFVGIVGTILAFLILTAPGALQQFVSSSTLKLS